MAVETQVASIVLSALESSLGENSFKYNILFCCVVLIVSAAIVIYCDLFACTEETRRELLPDRLLPTRLYLCKPWEPLRAVGEFPTVLVFIYC